MRRVILFLIPGLFSGCLFAQKQCSSVEYAEHLGKSDLSVQQKILAAESFIQSYRPEIFSGAPTEHNTLTVPVITIPVVVHVLFKETAQNIPDSKIKAQIEVLNKAFRATHADTSKIPSYFRELSADCRIQFELAKIDPKGRATSGIVRKSTSITLFGIDDRIKFSSQGGDDAWDCNKYLNIWIGNLAGGLVGYSSPIGGPKEKDGVAIRPDAFGPGNGGIYNGGKTLVHEVGHWLGLKHIWGDATCGDDLVDDTPKQRTANRGCPSGIKITCDNAPYGDNYNNYMDQTNDDCMLMFTKGQMNRMRSVFAPGGPRDVLLSSDGCTGTPIAEAEPVEEKISVKVLNLFPNPAQKQLTVEVQDTDIIGSELSILNQFGQVVQRFHIKQMKTTIDLSNLRTGMYFINLQKGSEKYQEKFIKL